MQSDFALRKRHELFTPFVKPPAELLLRFYVLCLRHLPHIESIDAPAASKYLSDFCNTFSSGKYSKIETQRLQTIQDS